jgi:Spy/CpxP family protein refolding chaperone
MGRFFMGPELNPLTEEQRTQLDELNKRFQEETAEFREDLPDKSRELNSTLTSEKPDEKKAKTLQKEISALRAKLAEKRLDFRLELAKIVPESGLGRGFGRFLGIDPRMSGLPKRPGFSPLTEEQHDQLNEMNKKFREETAELRKDFRNTYRELRSVLDSEKPDEKKAKILQKDMSDLQAELSQKTLDFRLEVREILPESGYSRGYGRFLRRFNGYGLHMGWGRGMGRSRIPAFY